MLEMIRSALLEKVAGIVHGFGTRTDEPPPNLVTSQQVHGTEILEVREIPSAPLEGYDILITGRPGIAVAVKTADCQPILMIEPQKRLVAAVHAGWKGTLQRAAQVAVRKIIERGGVLENIVACLGPNMVGRCFEVEVGVQNDFEKEFPGWPILTPKNDAKWLLDVSETNRRQLLEIGIPEKQIDRIDLCTHCRPDLFWSYRRDGEEAGRMVSFIRILKT
jgi:YfiH family protein